MDGKGGFFWGGKNAGSVRDPGYMGVIVDIDARHCPVMSHSLQQRQVSSILYSFVNKEMFSISKK